MNIIHTAQYLLTTHQPSMVLLGFSQNTNHLFYICVHIKHIQFIGACTVKMANMLTLLLNHLVKLYSTAFSKSPRKTLSLGLFGSNGMRKNPWTNTLDPNVKSKALIHIANTIFVVYFSLPRSTNSESSTGVTCTVVPDVPRLRRKGRRDVANRFLKICFWKIASALEFVLPRYRHLNSWTGLL